MNYQLSLLYPLSSLRKIRDNFVDELSLASHGKKTSLAFIKNPLPQQPLIGNGEIFQVMVMGGSVFEKALAYTKKDRIVILNKQRGELPLFKNGDIFLAFFKNHLDPQVAVVALNFAFALEPKLRDGILDGKLLGSSKEHQFNGLVNKLIGNELENLIFLKNKRQIRIVVANDTICLIFAGLQKDCWENLVGGIIGTGTNFCFFPDKNTVANLESGNFSKFESTDTGKEVDKKSAHKGEYLFEKEVAGTYLFQHYNLLLEDLGLNGHRLHNTLELSQVAQKNIGQETSVARQLLERSASLAACQIAGIYQFLKRKQLTFIMEGALFWEGWKYKEIVENYLKRLGIPSNSVKFKKIENSGILGGARIVVGN